jgi:hypothetical protein
MNICRTGTRIYLDLLHTVELPTSEVLLNSSSFGVNGTWLMDKWDMRYTDIDSIRLKDVPSAWSPYYEPM